MWFSIVINQSKQFRYFLELALGYVHTTMPYWKVFAPARKPYQIGSLLTHKNGDFGAISVTEQCCAAPIFKVDSHCLLYQIAFRDCTFSSAPQRSFLVSSGGKGDKKERCVWWKWGKREREREREIFPCSHRPPRAYFYFLLQDQGVPLGRRECRDKKLSGVWTKP